MQIEFSRAFVKDLRKLPNEILCSLGELIQQIERIESVRTLPNCKKLQGSHNTYRIRIRGYRAVFLLIQQDDKVFFQRILTRGQIYKEV